MNSLSFSAAWWRCVRARGPGSPGRAGAMSAAAAAPALPAAAPQQIEEEEERDGTTHFLVRWLPPAAASTSWVSAAQVVGRPEFEGVLQEWEVAKASGLAAAQEGSSDDDVSGDDSGEDSAAAGEEEGPDERLQELGMAAAVKAAESGGSCEEAALAAADSVRAAGGSEEEAIAVRTHFPLLSVAQRAVPCCAERVGAGCVRRRRARLLPSPL